jgi:hypothetical protein
MILVLSNEQLQELEQALDLHLLRLEGELVHTDDRAFKADLRKRYEILEGIRQRLRRPDPGRRIEQQDYSPVSDFPKP